MRGVSAHEIYTAGNKHADAGKIHKASADVIDAFAELDVAGMWGDGRTAAVDGSQIDTWENNLLAESLDPLRRVRRDRVPADLRHLHRPVLPLHPLRGLGGGVHPGLAAGQRVRRSSRPGPRRYPRPDAAGLRARGVAGFELLPRIRNWHDLIFYRPDPRRRYRHIDSLFGDDVIDWDLIEKHWPDLLRAGISIREGRLSSVTLLRRLGNHSAAQPAVQGAAGARPGRPDDHAAALPVGAEAARPHRRDHQPDRAVPQLRHSC